VREFSKPNKLSTVMAEEIEDYGNETGSNEPTSSSGFDLTGILKDAASTATETGKQYLKEQVGGKKGKRRQQSQASYAPVLQPQDDKQKYMLYAVGGLGVLLIVVVAMRNAKGN
jgi:hypothetical protein